MFDNLNKQTLTCVIFIIMIPSKGNLYPETFFYQVAIFPKSKNGLAKEIHQINVKTKGKRLGKEDTKKSRTHLYIE